MKVGVLLRKPHFLKTLYKRDLTRLRYGLYTKTKSLDDTVPTYDLKPFFKCNNETILKKNNSKNTKW